MSPTALDRLVRTCLAKEPDDRWQDAHARLAKNKATYKPVPMEHFGFIDGISNPVFEGQFGDPHADAAMAIGNGKVMDKTPDGDDDSRWAPLATGEFLLGHPDEAQETDDTAPPPAIMRNGTFLIYRKLHENVGRFNAYFTEAAKIYAKANNVPVADAATALDSAPASTAAFLQQFHSALHRSLHAAWNRQWFFVYL